MSKADHDQHRRDIDGIHTDMALLDEDLNNRVDALESTINTRFDDINDLGENTDHEVELLKARVSALESIRTQDDTIRNEFKVGDRVVYEAAMAEGVITGLVFDAGRSDPTRFTIRWNDGSVSQDEFTADELRHADAGQNRTESGTELPYDKGGVLFAQEAQGMAWVDLEEERTYRKIAEDKRTEANQAKWVAEARVKELEKGLDRREAQIENQCALIVARRKRADDAERERDEARETAFDLAVDYDSAIEELGAVWRERVSYARKLDKSRRLADNWKTRALKAESDVVNADLAESRAASEKRIDPAGAGRGVFRETSGPYGYQCVCGGTYSPSGDCGCGRVYGRVGKGPNA